MVIIRYDISEHNVKLSTSDNPAVVTAEFSECLLEVHSEIHEAFIQDFHGNLLARVLGDMWVLYQDVWKAHEDKVRDKLEKGITMQKQ